MLKDGGMNLRKWCSNNSELLSNLKPEQISKIDIFKFKSEETMKTLGLKWSPKDDVFTFEWKSEDNEKKLTKRTLLSLISKLFDPLGWLAPITISAKLLFQTVWLQQIHWDAELSDEIKQQWKILNKELQLINNTKINRWLGSVKRNIQLHGFCDASEKAYACVIYSRVTDEHGATKMTLLTAKTKVVPIAQKTTLPRLELCGALLLSQLMDKVKKSLSGYDVTTFAWSDSKVVLAWLQGNTSKWERYVANRVEKIISVIPSQQWSYVNTETNPADCATRGMLPSKMMNFSLWWNGPSFLENFNEEQTLTTHGCFFTTKEGCKENHEEEKRSNKTENFIEKLLREKCSITQIHRIVAWVIRCVNRLRKLTQRSNSHLTTDELKTSADCVLKYVQQQQFAQDYKQLVQNKLVASKSNIYKLTPYIDNQGIIRVGGRLQHSILPETMKNPAIVPSSGRYTELIIEHAHLMTLHGGARLTLSYLRQRHWVISGNRTARLLS